MARFQIFKDQGGEYRWRLRADNNEVIASSAEGYKRRSDCEHGIALVKQAAPTAEIEDQAKGKEATAMTTRTQRSGTGTTEQNRRSGVRVFWVTLAVLIALVAVYAGAHLATLRRSEYLHYEATNVVGATQNLLVTVAVLESQLETPAAVASPAVEALLHDLEQSVLRAETSDEVDALFDAVTGGLTELGIREDVSPKILEGAEAKAIQLVSAEEERREAVAQLLSAELETAQAWALDALGAEVLLEQVGQLKEAVDGLGYAPDSEVSQTLTDITQELQTDHPNRQLVAEMLDRVGDEVSAPSLFWSHSAMQWLEVLAWSLAGMLLVRLWTIGRFIAKDQFDPRWNWWWWAKIVQAPLLAVAVVLALSYFELGLVSGETLGFKISLRDQPIELVVALSFILGLFSDKAFEFLSDLADKVLGREEEQPGGGGDE